MILAILFSIYPHLLLGSLHSQFHLKGPGLAPDKVILPCRYFFITSESDSLPDQVTKDIVEVEIIGETMITEQYLYVWEVTGRESVGKEILLGTSYSSMSHI